MNVDVSRVLFITWHDKFWLNADCLYQLLMSLLTLSAAFCMILLSRHPVCDQFSSQFPNQNINLFQTTNHLHFNFHSSSHQGQHANDSCNSLFIFSFIISSMRNPSNPFDVYCTVPIQQGIWLDLQTHLLHFTPTYFILQQICDAHFTSGFFFCSVHFFVRDSDRLQWGRDAVSLVHRPAICPLHHLSCHHPTLVDPERNRHPEVHEVCSARPQSEWHPTFMFMMELFPPDFSVLGTLAATYLCVAVIVKYYLMESHMVVITPEHSQGSVTRSFLS